MKWKMYFKIINHKIRFPLFMYPARRPFSLRAHADNSIMSWSLCGERAYCGRQAANGRMNSGLVCASGWPHVKRPRLELCVCV